MSVPCFGRTFPNCPGKARGGCRGRCPPLVWNVVPTGSGLEGFFDTYLFQYVDTFPAAADHSNSSVWHAMDTWPNYNGKSHIQKAFTGGGTSGPRWEWNLHLGHPLVPPGYIYQQMDNFGPGFHCHQTTSLQLWAMTPGSPTTVPSLVLLLPVGYADLPAGFCTPRTWATDAQRP